ncbi:MAG: WYL domain-containing protein [Firmicutes bacterium]|nr:WYL domain-containing protein [Bacillota bacterium]
MIFSEIYGSYYQAVSAILSRAVEGTLDERSLIDAVQQYAFGESVVTIPARLKDGSWPLLTADLRTPLRHAPATPLSLLEKRWLKALLLDPRIRLFDPPTAGLEEVEPLFRPEDFVYFDRYADGDDFEDPRYVEHFRLILRALREKRKLRVRFHGHSGLRHSFLCIPYRLEYSAKDDKFRLLTAHRGKPLTVNLSRIYAAELAEPWEEREYRQPREWEQTLVMEVYDLRNALERAMLHFSDLEKETEKLEEGRYRVRMRYRQSDETELLIRVLSFGPVLKVIEPVALVEQIKQRLQRQAMLNEQAE